VRGYGSPFRAQQRLPTTRRLAKPKPGATDGLQQTAVEQFTPTSLPLPFMPILTEEQLLRTKLFAMGLTRLLLPAAPLQAGVMGLLPIFGK